MPGVPLIPALVAGLALGAVLGGAGGCARQPERLWYKPGQPYTLMEFDRDKADCTRDGKLNFECMRARGWVDVSPSRPPSKESEGARGPTY